MFVKFYEDLPRGRGATRPPLLLVMDSLFSSQELRDYIHRKGHCYITSANVQWAMRF